MALARDIAPSRSDLSLTELDMEEEVDTHREGNRQKATEFNGQAGL